MPKKKNPTKELIEIIKTNPGCIAFIDNDCWRIEGKGGKELASSVTLGCHSYGPGQGRICGGDILQALARIVGIKIRSNFG